MNGIPFDVLWLVRGVFAVLFGATLYFLKGFADSVKSLTADVNALSTRTARIEGRLSVVEGVK